MWNSKKPNVSIKIACTESELFVHCSFVPYIIVINFVMHCSVLSLSVFPVQGKWIVILFGACGRMWVMFYSDIHENIIHTVINVDESKYGRRGEWNCFFKYMKRFFSGWVSYIILNLWGKWFYSGECQFSLELWYDRRGKILSCGLKGHHNISTRGYWNIKAFLHLTVSYKVLTCFTCQLKESDCPGLYSSDDKWEWNGLFHFVFKGVTTRIFHFKVLCCKCTEHLNVLMQVKMTVVYFLSVVSLWNFMYH